MYLIKDVFIDITNIRKIHYEVDDYGNYLVITYAFDQENPTRIMVDNLEQYFAIGNEISDYIRNRGNI